MKGIKAWLLCLMALVLLLTACPTPESTVPKGKVTVSLSDEAINYFSDNDSITVELRKVENANNLSEGVFTLSRSKPYATYSVVPGKYNIIMTNSNNLPVLLSDNTVEVTENSDLQVQINLADSGTVTIQADTESLDESDILHITFSGNSGYSFSLKKTELNDSITLPAGTYHVTVNTSSASVDASVAVEDITVEVGKNTELPVSFMIYGDIHISCTGKPAMPLTLEVLKDDESFKTIEIDSESKTDRLPVGTYTLVLSSNDKDVDISLKSNEVTIEKGAYSEIKVSYTEKGSVQFDLTDKLINVLRSSEGTFTVHIKSGNIPVADKEFSKDNLDDRTISLPVGSYDISLDFNLGSNKVTSIQNDFEISKGAVATINLDLEEIGHISFEFNDAMTELGDDEYLSVLFYKGGSTVKEIKITKEFDPSDSIEIPTGSYDVSVVSSDSTKYLVDYEPKKITVLDEIVKVYVNVIKAGKCEFSIENAAGIKSNRPIKVNFYDGETLVATESITGSSEHASIILPEGTYSVTYDYDETFYNVTVSTESVTIKNGENPTIKMTVATDGSIDITIDVGYEPSFKFKIIKYTEYDTNTDKDITYLEVVGASSDKQLSENATVIWYDPDPLNHLKENVGARKAYEILEHRLSRIEVRIILDGEIIAARKIDVNKIEDVGVK